MRKKKGKIFEISEKTLFKRINDLAGFRIIHLHTTQFQDIDRELRSVLSEHRYKIVEGPIAHTWDDEQRQYFKSIGVKTANNLRMYTSVHYVVQPNSRTLVTCEIQVRTLAEELWGEVDHTINYPEQSDVLACREQIKVLARVTSSASRLVDSIFRSLGNV